MLGLLKFGATALAMLLALVAAGAAGLYVWSNGELSATVPVPTHELRAPTSDSVASRGEHGVTMAGGGTIAAAETGVR